MEVQLYKQSVSLMNIRDKVLNDSYQPPEYFIRQRAILDLVLNLISLVI